jgi:cell division protein FtsQ
MELSLPLPRRARVGVPNAGVRPLAWLSSKRLVPRVLLCVLLSVPLLSAGWLWFRDSSLVSVRHVHITGVEGIDAAQIRTTLDDAAMRMTTLDFNAAVLRSAVVQYPIVAGLHVHTSFPHTVSIAVVERPPVAALLSDGRRTAVAADGTVLGPGLLSSSLPAISASAEPLQGAHLHESSALAAVTVLAAAPAQLERFVVRAYSGSEGLTVAMRSGLLVYFGNATRPHAKWLSLARVLASPSSAGAIYVDVRLPERPAAGFSFSTASSEPSSTSTQAGASSETAATLAAGLEAAIGVNSTTPATSSEPSSSATSAPNGAEASSTGDTETAPAASGNEASSVSGGSDEPASGSTTEATSTLTTGG